MQLDELKEILNKPHIKEMAERLIKIWFYWHPCDYYIADVTEDSENEVVDFLINEKGCMYHLTVHHTKNQYMMIENDNKEVLVKITSNGID